MSESSVARIINLTAAVIFMVRISGTQIPVPYGIPSPETCLECDFFSDIFSRLGALASIGNADSEVFKIEPPNGSYIWIDYMDMWGYLCEIQVFSDTNCQNPLTTVTPSKETISGNRWTECVFMGDGVHWGSVMVEGELNRVDG